MNQIIFYVFGALAVFSAMLILFFRNPVTSAISMVVSFASMAVIYIGLDAHFLGVMQILVYTGAVMILFLFIIMLLNVKQEERKTVKIIPLLGGLAVVALFLAQLVGIISTMPTKEAPVIDPLALAKGFEKGTQVHEQLSQGNYPDASLLGMTLFGQFNGAFLITGVILVVATVGVVSLSRRPESQK